MKQNSFKKDTILKILIIDTIYEKKSLHFDEFVKPIENILKSNNINFKTYHFLELNNKIINNFDKIIICGTPLKDFSYLDNLDKFNWIKKCNKPILGICAGYQIIGKIFGANLIDIEEIGMINISKLKENILFAEDKLEVYSLHKKSLTNLGEFEILAESKKCVQAIKHKSRKTSQTQTSQNSKFSEGLRIVSKKNSLIYGVLFHPEVKQEKIIINFIKNS